MRATPGYSPVRQPQPSIHTPSGALRSRRVDASPEPLQQRVRGAGAQRDGRHSNEHRDGWHTTAGYTKASAQYSPAVQRYLQAQREQLLADAGTDLWPEPSGTPTAADDARELTEAATRIQARQRGRRSRRSAAARRPEDPLQAELSGLKLRALKRRAAAEGVSPELIDEADDADDVRTELIELIAEAVAQREAAADADAAAREAAATDEAAAREAAAERLRAELRQLRMRALKTRAIEEGVLTAKLDEADDADDRQATIIGKYTRNQSPACGF